MIFQLLKEIIVKIERIEKYIAIRNGKLNIHQKKWGVQSSIKKAIDISQDYIREYVNRM